MKESGSRNLETLSFEMNIPLADRLGDAPSLEDLENIDELINQFNLKYRKNIILYGGQVARSELLGLTNMRKHTSDIEYYCHHEDALREILANEPVHYLPKYDIVYCYKENINITFSYKHIHDLYIPDDFIISGVNYSSPGISVYCANAEYSIMLKMRRIFQQMQKGLNPFGKDALDIINLLCAGIYKTDLKEVNIEKLFNYLVTYIVRDRKELLDIYKFINKYKRQLPKIYHDGYERISTKLYSELKTGECL